VGLAAAMAAVVLALCLVHGYLMKQDLADTRAKIAEAQRPRQEITELNGRISTLEGELKQLDKKRQASTGIDPTESLIRQKKRIPALLEAMSHLVSNERVITRLRAEGRGSVTIEGLCLSPGSADCLAVGLARELGASGWEVRGAQKSARLTNPDGGPWEFKVTLLPSGTLPHSSSTASATGTTVKAGNVKETAGGAQ